MGTNKKPRKKYRPKPVHTDTMAYVRSGMKKLDDTTVIVGVRIRNHQALEELRLGRATQADITTLDFAFLMTEGFLSMDASFGRDWATEVQAARDALQAVENRQLEHGRYICRAEEWIVMTLAMEVHDAQLDHATVKDTEAAMDAVKRMLTTKERTT